MKELRKSDKIELKSLADALAKTLSSDMDCSQADAVVKDVAETIYKDILGKKGRFVKTVMRVCDKRDMGIAPHGNSKTLWDYEWIEDE